MSIIVDTFKRMKITYDDKKNIANIERRGLSFDLVVLFDMQTALIWLDDRVDYGEKRYCALGLIGLRVYFLVFTPRHDVVRVISLRKANKREVKRYVQQA